MLSLDKTIILQKHLQSFCFRYKYRHIEDDADLRKGPIMMSEGTAANYADNPSTLYWVKHAQLE